MSDTFRLWLVLSPNGHVISQGYSDAVAVFEAQEKMRVDWSVLVERGFHPFDPRQTVDATGKGLKAEETR